ncbi:MAG: hypothetical protein ACRBG0_00825 [Lewinella sp.]
MNFLSFLKERDNNRRRSKRIAGGVSHVMLLLEVKLPKEPLNGEIMPLL